MADVSKINVNGTEVNVKDATARQSVETISKSAIKASYESSTETITLTTLKE